jgi:hypothetical protein
MKSVLIDASSAILLYKAGWLDATLAHYRLQTGQAAARELTVPGYPGAARFRQLTDTRALAILDAPPAAAQAPGGAALTAMGPGERECIQHFLAGAGDFILMDDGRGAAFCRDHSIPYTSALLIPRILSLADPGVGGRDLAAATARIYALGRYAPWVLAYARRCEDADLAPFRP